MARKKGDPDPKRQPAKAGEKQAVPNPGQWKKGQSGNPRGTATGSRHKTTLLCEALIKGQAEAIINELIRTALSGNPASAPQCLRALADRLVPLRKGRPITISLPPIETSGDLIKVNATLLQAVANAELTPEEAAAMAGLVEAQRRAIETDDHARRLAAIEAQLAGRKT